MRGCFSTVPRLAVLLASALAGLAGPALGRAYTQSPVLQEKTAAGVLAPVGERLPSHPLVVDVSGLGGEPGRHGGTLHLLMGRTKDVRLMVVYGYARLVGYDRHYEIVPDILESIDVSADRVFTFKLRAGHRWSDGHPFTAEDFRYYWEDIANNDELSHTGVPKVMRVDGEAARFDVLDERTVRYTWSKPNPYFLARLAGTRPLEIFAPAHYLKAFHARYTSPEALAAKVEEAGQRNWSALHHRKDRPYKNNNPDRPTLQPWVNTTAGPSQRFVFERNPYFHRVDENGLQLPYIDRVVMNVVDGKLIPAKTGAGETDLQARHLNFSDFTFLKAGEQRAGYDVRLWQTTKGSHIALYPNLNVEDPVWRKLIRDVRLRRALSLAIDRHQLNQVLYYGLAVEGNNAVHEATPFFKPEYREKWARFDVDAANALLDELGLTERDSRGLRLLPDGRPMVIVVETAGEDTEQVDALELIGDNWLKIGVKVFSKPMQREVFRNRIFAGSTIMSVWGGLENGLPTANISPEELAPTSQQQLQWPKWGQYFETGGAAGEPPDIPEAQALLRLNGEWASAPGTSARTAIWQRMMSIYTDQVFTIGLVAGVRQPVVVSRRLHNVPVKGIYNWEPGAHFGIYHPDTFWLSGSP